MDAGRKLHVALIFGGRSAEHDVSILSARSIHGAIPRERFDVTPVCVARDGHFVPPERSAAILERKERSAEGDPSFSFDTWVREVGIDIAFPVIHGTFGEDGTLQGYLEFVGVPYVGSGVTGSAVGMDKLMMKAVFAAHGLPQVAHRGLDAHGWRVDRERVMSDVAALAWPRFVKPANLGSSIGIARALDEGALCRAIEEALRYDRRVIVEEAAVGARELEVAVLGNDAPELSPIGEIRYASTFYDYESKYTEGMAELRIPTELPEAVAARVVDLARRAFRAIDGAGLARVDLFYQEDSGVVYLNEINTMPGFTATSMYPKLWEAAGVPYPDLVERLVSLARERR
jgi:D-alanine-D-alanine ligase